MKTIFTIAQVKNEGDIIESFCRYNLTYCDGMLIRDNNSNDNTKQIIQNLIDEGLPIFWADDIFVKYPQMYHIDACANLAIDEYNADLIISLDADEFLYHIDGINPRKTLEVLDEKIEYQAIWRTYVYEDEPDINFGFMPNNFNHYRNSALEQYACNRKVITSKFLIKEKQATFVLGAHHLLYPIEFQKANNILIHDKLVFAHFPIRSNYQIERKTITNWVYKWGVSNRVPRERLDIYQIGMLFNHLKKYGEFKKESLKKLSIIYAVIPSIENNLTEEGLNDIINKLGDRITIYDPMDISFCDNKLELQYTNFIRERKEFLQTVLKEIDNTIMLLDKESAEKSKRIYEIDKESTEKSKRIYEITQSFITERDNHKLEVNRLLNSKSWRYTKPLRIISLFVRHNKILFLIAKSLLSFKRIGINKTFKKIVKYVQRILTVYLILTQYRKTFVPTCYGIHSNGRNKRNRIPLNLIKGHTESVDIIICVHNAYDDVTRCINSVFEFTSEPFRLIIIDDGSDDQTKKYLLSVSENISSIKLIRNNFAKGYTCAANIGLRFSDAEYCILLNSDTIVTEGWLNKLIKCQKSDKNIGIVGPLSNTASWQSVPEIIGENSDWPHNELPKDIDLEQYAKVIELRSGCIYPKLPLLNGFCLLIHRSVIKSLGYLDEINFGSGFGEEDDYNLRANKAGFKLALADDTFIFHAQSKSFTNEKRLLLCEKNFKKLEDKYGSKVLGTSISIMQKNYILEGVRARIKIVIERDRLIKLAKRNWGNSNILFVFPIFDIVFSNEIIQDAINLKNMGININFYFLYVFKKEVEINLSKYNIPIIFGDDFNSLKELSSNFDLFCFLIFSINDFDNFNNLGINAKFVYYIQNLNLFCFNNETINIKKIFDYLMANSNTKIIIKNEVKDFIIDKQNDINFILIGRSIEIDWFWPRKMFPNRDKRVIAAIIQPTISISTSVHALNILNVISKKYGSEISIFAFDPDLKKSNSDLEFWKTNRKASQIKVLGKLDNNSIISLLSEADILIDFSHLQSARQLTMQAMACGCAVIVSQNENSSEFIIDDINGIIIDMEDKDSCINALCRLVDDYEYLYKIGFRGIRDVCRYYPERCTFNFLNACLT